MYDIELEISKAEEFGGSHIRQARNHIEYMNGVLTGYMTADVISGYDANYYRKMLRKQSKRLQKLEEV